MKSENKFLSCNACVQQSFKSFHGDLWTVLLGFSILFPSIISLGIVILKFTLFLYSHPILTMFNLLFKSLSIWLGLKYLSLNKKAEVVFYRKDAKSIQLINKTFTETIILSSILEVLIIMATIISIALLINGVLSIANLLAL